ncbi:DNA-binding transcriptional regulator, MarR family [Anaerovirgula multivorans]|uniref:DNA-binding transcriptional regulator, MarR family n=2 Tax=Anaerovirgula multivorans TaxID=312168 RepID=A0A239HDX1_9FIRM|nr:DNA-binding transcriptional regulator, MarR family [Anaerovirgula multivorans]
MRYQYKNMDQDKCLTLSQFQVLFIIKDFGLCNMSCLSEAIEVSKGTMTSMLNKLVEEGYVERSTSPKDRRNVYVSLTPKGDDKVNYMKEKLLKAIVETLSQLEENQKEEIDKGLETLGIAFKVKRS